MFHSLLYLHLTIKKSDDSGDIREGRNGKREVLVTLSVKCQNVLANCAFLTRPYDSRGEMEGQGRVGRRWEECKHVLLKAGRRTDKEISFVILSGRGRKKERF